VNSIRLSAHGVGLLRIKANFAPGRRSLMNDRMKTTELMQDRGRPAARMPGNDRLYPFFLINFQDPGRDGEGRKPYFCDESPLCSEGLFLPRFEDVRQYI
jgi:hypothetical protein